MNAPHLPTSRWLARTAFAVAPAFAPGAVNGQAVVTFAPLTATTLTLPADGEAFVQYQVTNPSALARTLAMTPITGVTIDPGSGHCADPFVLAPLASCVLALHLVGSAMGGDIGGGPVVCVASNPLQCAQPAPADQLHVTWVPVPMATIDAMPSALTIPVGSTATITLGNAAASPIAVQNLAIGVPPASSIVVDIGTCAAPLPPGATCTFAIAGTAVETATTLAISADHTTSISVTVTLFDDVVFDDGFDPLPG